MATTFQSHSGGWCCTTVGRCGAMVGHSLSTTTTSAVGVAVVLLEGGGTASWALQSSFLISISVVVVV